MSNIFVRSPYFISVTGSANDDTRVDLYIWNGTGAAPGTPTRVLSKPIPSSVITQADYNISPYVREYIEFEAVQANTNYNTNAAATTTEWCNVVVKTYLNGALVETLTHKAFDGYSEYLDGMNYEQTNDVHLSEGTYYYYYDPVNAIASYDSIRPGNLQVVTGSINYTKVKYTNLDTLATTTVNLNSSEVRRIYRVTPTYYGYRVKTEVLDDTNAVIATFYFYPIEECRYNVITVDFVNRYGAWDRTFMFKASRNDLSYKGTDYNLAPDAANYNEAFGTKAVYNVNYNEGISCNTGWVNEEYHVQLRQLLASERVILSSLSEFGDRILIPVKLRTKQLNVQKHINDKLINYTVEFDYAFDGLNNVQ